MQYIKRSDRQFKANLHSHTNLSDGALTPEEMVKAYKEQGYAVLAITDHEAPYEHNEFTTDDFLMLTGWEAYIRRTAECKVDNFGPEIHLNLIAKDPHNTTYIAYDPNFCKYMPHELAESLKQAGTELGPRKYNREYINAFIKTAREQGYLVTYNHPVWSMEEPESILNYDGFFSLEIFNTGSVTINGQESNLPQYERLLRHGKFPFVHGADDNHNKKPFSDLLNDSFGSWTMIIADELKYDSIIDSLEKGRFYASTGPEIHELTFDGKNVHLEFSEAQRVIMCMSEKKALNAYNSDGSSITSADFEIPDYAPYLFFIIKDAAGKEAVTHAFTREQLGI